MLIMKFSRLFLQLFFVFTTSLSTLYTHFLPASLPAPPTLPALHPFRQPFYRNNLKSGNKKTDL